jgi:hypothetical protein
LLPPSFSSAWQYRSCRCCPWKKRSKHPFDQCDAAACDFRATPRVHRASPQKEDSEHCRVIADGYGRRNDARR